MNIPLKTLLIIGLTAATGFIAAPQAKAVVDLQIEAPDTGSDSAVADVSSTPVLNDPTPVTASPNQVPEPTTMVLSALGGASLLLLRRRK